MKHFIIGIALALALAIGIVAFAETATEQVPAVTEEIDAEEISAEEAAPEEDTATETPAEDAVAETANDTAALQEALEAYRAAKESKRVDDLVEELNGYVEAGTLTREQADLILNSVKEQMAVNHRECPNCGYKFQNNGPRMGDQMPGNQRRKMNGQMPSNQQPDAQSGAMPQQPNGR